VVLEHFLGHKSGDIPKGDNITPTKIRRSKTLMYQHQDQTKGLIVAMDSDEQQAK